MAPNCPKVKENKGMKVYGYEKSGQLFYSIYVPLEDDDIAKSPITAVMKRLKGKGSMAKITMEL
jgi:hypothetical protein